VSAVTRLTSFAATRSFPGERSIDNVHVPFTLAHAAAVLPFRRSRLVPAALVVGAFAPDFEYFIRLSPGGGFGHTLLGAFVFTLPLALVVLWIFESAVKAPFVSLLPEGLELRLSPYLGKFRFLPPVRLALIVLSILAGIATHILWDSVTHGNRWPARHWPFLREPVRLLGSIPWFKVLQHGSTILGVAVLLVWAASWYRATTPAERRASPRFCAAQKLRIAAFGIAIASLGAVIRILPVTSSAPWKTCLGYAVVTWIAIAWWQLVAFGLLTNWRASSKLRPTGIKSLSD
jgi:membrane-bound metal-dependent hydrolase YbcI (DUF457 family)